LALRKSRLSIIEAVSARWFTIDPARAAFADRREQPFEPGTAGMQRVA
jgi:hypothetical protein